MLCSHLPSSYHGRSISTSCNARELADMPSAIDLTGPLSQPPQSIPAELQQCPSRYELYCNKTSNCDLDVQWHQQGQAMQGAQAEPPWRNKPLAPLGLYTRELAFAFLWLSCKGAKIHRVTPSRPAEYREALIKYWH
ncbi:hypothetical protein H0G86_003007 [Trichoderma simmonsii]|uniref:Uncharacterized protein n=1 Tax=Trichoderma simmonsii TaxID=1491479 RepID=A0A8G0PCR1_9HYPO|nr:hypothetical protein H0G86_003007 [Trichoderma simmonsii]